MLRSFPIHGVLATQVPSSGPESLPPFATRNDPSHSRKDLSLIPEYPPLSRNIPPYPRISPPFLLVHNILYRNNIRGLYSILERLPLLIIKHLRMMAFLLSASPKNRLLSL